MTLIIASWLGEAILAYRSLMVSNVKRTCPDNILKSLCQT